MFGSNLANYPYINPVNTYSANLGRAARTFLAALLAVEPSKIDTVLTRHASGAQDQAAGIDELNHLADHFDSIMPNQAAELRYLAGSGA